MTWRDQITANSAGSQRLRGSFKGAGFIVPTDELEFGRRTQVHEFPQRDEPYVEDLGRKARRFQVEVFVAGDYYLFERDALIAKIEEGGPGLFIHPFYGTLNVTVVESRVRQSSREGGKATFSLTFVEAGENIFLPTIDVDTSAGVDTKATTATESSLQQFARKFSVEGLTGFSLAKIQAELSRTIAGVTKVVGDIANTVAAEIRAPYNMAGLIVGGVQQIASLAATPFEALRLYKGLFDAGSGGSVIPHTTRQRRQQAQATHALHELVRTSAVIEAARTASSADFASSDEALALRADLLSALDARLSAIDPVSGEPIDADLFDSLRALRAAMVEDFRLRAAKLPQITAYTPKAMIPARVIAWQLYGDAARAEEIVSRNNIRHPLFVPGGQALEVLTDA